jgi:hypothetical protein
MDRHYSIEVYSVRFDFEGSGAISLRDPRTDAPITTHREPEWIRDERSEPAAYVRGTQPEIEVVFFLVGASGGTYLIGAEGPNGGVAEQRVELVWDNAAVHTSRAGMSKPVRFKLARPLPDAIGTIALHLSWYMKPAPGADAQRISMGDSTHALFTTWRPLFVNEDDEHPAWAYTTILAWASTWAAGKNDEKSICDALLQNLYRSGLQYGVAGWDVRFMLLTGGGMCGGWVRLFQALAASQGVLVDRRMMAIDWRTDFLGRKGQEGWCGIVLPSPGQNQAASPDPPAHYHDYPDSAPFPIVTAAHPHPTAASRYEFWGYPDYRFDGHYLNFLEFEGQLYLYDPSFGHGPIALDMPMPPMDWQKLGGLALASFKASYLDPYVTFMLGSLYDGDTFYKTVVWGKGSTPEDPTGIPIPVNGLTVKTASIPDVVEDAHGQPVDGVTFYWGP